jgi:hypothetical protein
MRTSLAVLATATAATITMVSGCASTSSHQGDSVVPAAGATSPGTSVVATPAGSPVGSPSIATPTAKPTAAPTATESSSAKATPVVHDVDDTANGTTVHVRVGDTVRVTLHSTYWQMDPPSTSALKAGDSTVAASLRPGSVPGSGTGTVVTSYLIVRSGTTKITAQRTSCGEALLCPPNLRSYVVTLAITAS